MKKAIKRQRRMDEAINSKIGDKEAQIDDVTKKLQGLEKKVID